MLSGTYIIAGTPLITSGSTDSYMLFKLSNCFFNAKDFNFLLQYYNVYFASWGGNDSLLLLCWLQYPLIGFEGFCILNITHFTTPSFNLLFNFTSSLFNIPCFKWWSFSSFKTPVRQIEHYHSVFLNKSADFIFHFSINMFEIADVTYWPSWKN